MFTTKAKPASVPSGKAAVPSILSLDLQVTGNIVTSGEVHVFGSVKGDINAKKVTISEGASVTGAIEAESALVLGAVTGRLTATSVMLAATAGVAANITHVTLTIEQARCSRAIVAASSRSTRPNRLHRWRCRDRAQQSRRSSEGAEMAPLSPATSRRKARQPRRRPDFAWGIVHRLSAHAR